MTPSSTATVDPDLLDPIGTPVTTTASLLPIDAVDPPSDPPALTLANLRSDPDHLPDWARGGGLRLPVPIRTQLDGTAYARANCGPAALGMVLEAFGLRTSTDAIRYVVNQIQGTTGDYTSGTSAEAIKTIAEDGGLGVYDLYTGGQYRRWTLDDLRAHIRERHPVIVLTKYRYLPGNEWSGSESGHYVVITGLIGQGFIYNDSAYMGALGTNRVISPGALEAAWTHVYPARQALALGAVQPHAGRLLATATVRTPTIGLLDRLSFGDDLALPSPDLRTQQVVIGAANPGPLPVRPVPTPVPAPGVAAGEAGLRLGLASPVDGARLAATAGLDAAALGTTDVRATRIDVR